MKSLVQQLQTLFRRALIEILGDAGRDADPMIRAAGDERFGDYQSNVAMGLAKMLQTKPRDLAQRIVAALPQETNDLCEPMEIAGPGFINIRLRADRLAEMLEAVPPTTAPDRLGIEPGERPHKVVVDYSGPNIAKQMHVGHLRSTIIGDTIARMLEYVGHEVVRQNHIGDWGTQFGMLCAFLKDKMPEALSAPETVHLEDLEDFYRQASARDKEDPAFHEQARAEVVALHNHEPSTLRAWQYIVDESRRHYMPIYRRLGVSLTPADERGESFYAERLSEVVDEFRERFGTESPAARIVVRPDQGALCIFHLTAEGEPRFKNPEDQPLPMIIRKSDGAFLYATTDLAALRFRIRDLGARQVIYVTDARQALHFEMLFATAEAASWTTANDGVQLDHVTFGSILGEDRKPLKTRSGENIKLADLLDEAVRRAEQLIRAGEADETKRRGFNEEQIKDIAEAVGIGAVKYADLSQNRQSDYVFSWDKMLAMEGNTAPYMMYAYARIRSIYRKGAETIGEKRDGKIVLDESAERLLARQILRFPETIEAAVAGLKINLLTDYLYALGGVFMKFYESCPVLKADTPERKASRLRLCELTARTLRIGLDLLGILVVERM
ncbi:MAG: arginine--tRNA ligase [Phycisphaerales bacterium]|nr:arginine--tRNA ligase [Phycisphaerales bacterium]